MIKAKISQRRGRGIESLLAWCTDLDCERILYIERKINRGHQMLKTLFFVLIISKCLFFQCALETVSALAYIVNACLHSLF